MITNKIILIFYTQTDGSDTGGVSSLNSDKIQSPSPTNNLTTTKEWLYAPARACCTAKAQIPNHANSTKTNKYPTILATKKISTASKNIIKPNDHNDREKAR